MSEEQVNMMAETASIVDTGAEVIASSATQVADSVTLVAGSITTGSEAISSAVAEGSATLDNVMGGMDKLLQGTLSVLEKYAEPTAQLALNVLRIEALSLVLPSLLMLMAAGVFYKFGLIQRLFEGMKERQAVILNMEPAPNVPAYYHYEGLVLSMLVPIMCYVVINAIVGLFNLWAWVGVVSPEIYAVHKFLLN